MDSRQLVPASMSQGRRRDRSMLTMSDDNVMMKQVVETHVPDGREVNVNTLLLIIEDILRRATLNVDSSHSIESGIQSHLEIEDKIHQTALGDMLDALSYTIDKISCEVDYQFFGGGDAHQSTLSLLDMLASFSWDAKLVMALEVVALKYGRFCLLSQLSSINQLAKSLATLKQVIGIMEHFGQLKPRIDALDNLIRAMLEVTKCVVAFKELPSMYISRDVQALSIAEAHIPIAVYWTIRSVLACATQINTLSNTGYGATISTGEAWELSTLAHKLNNILEHLKKQLAICFQHIEEKRNIETYRILLNLFEMIHVDNMKILKALIYAKDDIQPLVDGSTKKRVNIDVLRRKNVLLLISGLDISQDELSILEQIYNESRIHASRLESYYEVVWIPIVDRSIQWSDPMQKKFESLQSTMPWYSVHHPSLIDKAVIRFIKEEWHFRHKPILVVLDSQGRVVSPNAIHMMWIWGGNAFPFTSMREEALWKEETWKLELLVDGIDPTILNWVREGKYIFLYGGDDIEWIRKFTTTARAVAQAARIPLEMVYVGKSSKREQVRRIIASITVEKLSYCWQDLTMIWFFWIRLESMLFSKIQLKKEVDHDPMMLEIKKLLSYDNNGGWAVLSNGPSIVINGRGTTILPTLIEYDLWKEHVPVKGFDVAFKDHHMKIHDVSHSCCRFEFPSTIGQLPEIMQCPECLRNMEKLFTFRCCHEEVAWDAQY